MAGKCKGRKNGYHSLLQGLTKLDKYCALEYRADGKRVGVQTLS